MKQRLEWVDYIKGFCVLWMILFQCSLRSGYTFSSEGWVYELSQLGRPLRMPVIFMLSGLFFTSSLQKSWREFMNTRLLHVIYLFVLWTVIMIVLRNLGSIGQIPLDLLYSLTITPFLSLWFLMVWIVIMTVVRVCRNVPAWLMLGVALLLELSHIGPFYPVIDNSSRYFIYFLIGLYGKEHIMQLSFWFERQRAFSIMVVFIFAVINYYMVRQGLWAERGYGLGLSLFALVTIIPLGQLLQKANFFHFLKFAGQHSLIFFLGYGPFVLIIAQFLKTRMTDSSSYTLALYVFGVGGAYSMCLLVNKFKMNWLFEKPAALKIE